MFSTIVPGIFWGFWGDAWWILSFSNFLMIQRTRERINLVNVPNPRGPLRPFIRCSGISNHIELEEVVWHLAHDPNNRYSPVFIVDFLFICAKLIEQL